MNIFEYAKNGNLDDFYYDEYGNIYIDKQYANFTLNNIMEDDYKGTLYLPKDIYDQYLKYSVKVTASQDEIENVSGIRRPYYRMRGRSVTKEQAFDIIRRTDEYFNCYTDIGEHRDYISNWNFSNWLIDKNHFPEGYGWIHVDGTVGSDGITMEYPTEEEFVIEWFEKLRAFPYLDLIIAMTNMNERPCIDWRELYYCRSDRKMDFYDTVFDQDSEKFFNLIQFGIYVHDTQIELLNRQETIEVYKEYDELYGQPAEKFHPEYYEQNHITQVNEEYLRRCIKAYGLDPDTELSKMR